LLSGDRTDVQNSTCSLLKHDWQQLGSKPTECNHVDHQHVSLTINAQFGEVSESFKTRAICDRVNFDSAIAQTIARTIDFI